MHNCCEEALCSQVTPKCSEKDYSRDYGDVTRLCNNIYSSCPSTLVNNLKKNNFCNNLKKGRRSNGQCVANTAAVGGACPQPTYKVVTFKNVALDHFLVDCTKYVSNIVRIGRTSREELNNIQLSKVIHETGIEKKHRASYMKACTEMRIAKRNLKKLFRYLSKPHFTVKSFLEAASKEHISSLLSMSPDSEQNEEKTLEEKLKTCVKTWLEEAKSQVESSLTKKRVEKFRCKTESRNEEEVLRGEAFDSNVTSKERQQDTVEDEVPLDDVSASYDEIQEGVNNEEPLTDGIEISSAEPDENSSLLDEDDLWSLTSTQRVNFLRALRGKLIAKFREAVESFEKNKRFRQDFLDERTVCVLKSYDVIAMTVTGAATRSHLLEKLKPCAVIVEEAAAIMEGQLVSILPKSLKHLVMIGDHYQLKPRVNCYKLLKKNLDCSMFERLINNKFPFVQLKQQCRMRDDIADLLREIKSTTT
ncbi:NFX1-type zinc finger-containing protein 1-like [Xenia sp. Carnegie-2017]|uniref:NFX1-type zinc finger-containing protein 1-like n=1 Tax=Xenia sp. Carnegie-2017 TaxID=2897299 RepID=UPI001F04B0E5|nr:NFX1-type zinc finger-containing protein 1-like [Xenia sp. Carnegie-2017]